MKKVTYRFISDPALGYGCWPTSTACRARRAAEPGAVPGRQALHGGHRRHRGKTIVAINNNKPFDGVRVRRDIAAAIDRKGDRRRRDGGLRRAIGSHLVPNDAGYVDTTGISPYDVR